MNDWIARIYIVQDDVEYKVKIFDNAVEIERQPPTHGGNLLYSHTQTGDLWNGTVFDSEVLAVLIDRYEEDTLAGYGASLDQ